MRLKLINSLNNEKVKLALKLKEKKYRQKYKLYRFEGYKLLQEALNKKAVVQEIFILEKNFENRKYKRLFNILQNKEIVIYKVNSKIYNKLTSLNNPEGFLSIAKIGNKKEINLKKERIILILDRINNPGNLGNILRSTLAFFVDTVVLSLDSVDIYNEKVIKASSGAFFYINFKYTLLFDFLYKLKKEYKYKIIGFSSNNIEKVNYLSSFQILEKKIALLFGSEHKGIEKNLYPLIDKWIKIYINPDIESLNLTNSVSIALFHIYNKMFKKF